MTFLGIVPYRVNLGKVDKMDNVRRMTYHGWVIQAALEEYKECQGLYDWVTIKQLYYLYCKKLSTIDPRVAWDDELDIGGYDPDTPITPQAFGAELRHVFPNAVSCNRWLNGKQYRGLAGLTGPSSQRSKKIG